MVKHSKCKKCGAILNALELKDNDEGVHKHKVCADEIKCKKRQEKSQNKS
ncbi:Uncharacterized protein pbN1_36210 [Aromatoleum bremense]|nr:Uncharacterized protein pbN1_36210 [Aromatoleum bremense]